ncbi:MAG TPA: energy-coupling factor transporter transmembrane component T [Candidatus Limnocylindria bacterium]
MRLFTPLRPDPGAPLARANPTAKLGAAVLLMLALFVSVDLLTPSLLLLVVLAAIPFTGIGPRTLLGRVWPIPLAALSVAILNALLAPETVGEVVLRIGPLVVGQGNVLNGAALGIRLLAISLSGVLALVSTEPAVLAGSLVQQLRLSPRFAIGGLAAARLLPILAAEWQMLALARRARGVSAGSPVGAVRLAFGQLLALLVAAVRRATRLAMAMEARGFGARPCRTVARPQHLVRSDWLLLAGAAAVAAGAIGLSLAIGSWRFVFA